MDDAQSSTVAVRGGWACGLLAATAALLAGACNANNPLYFGADQTPLEVGGKDDQGMDRPATATARIAIGFRAPSADEAAKLAADSGTAGYAVPWLRRSDLAIEVLYTVTNLDDKAGTAQILVDGASEFVNYDTAAIRAAAQAAAINNDPVNVFSLIQGTPFSLAPGGERRDVVREDEVGEAELDLDAIGRWMATPESVLINRSEVNPVGLEMVPKNLVVPALQTIGVTLTGSTHMRAQLLVRVRDAAGRLVGGSDTPFMPMPMDYVPPAPAQPRP